MENTTNDVDTQMTPDSGTEPPSMPQSAPMQPKKNMMLWTIVGVVVLLLIAAGAVLWYMHAHKAKPVAEVKTYKVGVMTYSHVEQSLSTGTEHGVALAQKAFETSNVKVQIVTKDTSCTAADATKAMQEFAAEGVVAVIGEFCSDATLAAAPVANSMHVPLISPASTSSKITTAGDYVYRTIPSDTLSTQFMANQMYTKYKVRKLAILHTTDTYGNDSAASLTTAFKALGGTIAVDKGYATNQTDVTKEVTAVKTSGADGMFIVGVGLNDLVLVKRHELAITVPVYGPEYFNDTSLIASAQGGAEGLVFDAPSSGNRSFTEQYQATYNKAAPTYSAQAYDAMAAILNGLRQGATTGATLKTQLDSLSFDGASGRIKFDANGDVAGNYQLFVVKEGKPALVE